MILTIKQKADIKNWLENLHDNKMHVMNDIYLEKETGFYKDLVKVLRKNEHSGTYKLIGLESKRDLINQDVKKIMTNRPENWFVEMMLGLI